MKKSVKELLRSDKAKLDVNLRRMLLFVVPMVLALLVSLASMNLGENNVLAAENGNSVEVISDVAPDSPEYTLIRTDADDSPSHIVVRLADADYVDVVVIRSAPNDMDKVVLRN